MNNGYEICKKSECIIMIAKKNHSMKLFQCDSTTKKFKKKKKKNYEEIRTHKKSNEYPMPITIITGVSKFFGSNTC